MQGRDQAERFRKNPENHAAGLGVHEDEGDCGGRELHHREQLEGHGRAPAPDPLHGPEARDHVREDGRVGQGRRQLVRQEVHLHGVLLPDAHHSGLDGRAPGVGKQRKNAH